MPRTSSRRSSSRDGDQRVLDKLVADLAAKDPAITPARINFELDHFAAQAKQQLMKE